MNLLCGLFLTGPSIVLDEGVSQAANGVVEAVTEGASQVATQATGFFGKFGSMGMILYIVGMVALFYFFISRPQKKREKEMVNIQNSIKAGDWVVTTSGFYGKVVDITEDVFMVEFGTNKGVRIPVKKSEIVGNKEPNLTSKASE